eukprot:14469508-Heterocapsa_arctica.AAC.1
MCLSSAWKVTSLVASVAPARSSCAWTALTTLGKLGSLGFPFLAGELPEAIAAKSDSAKAFGMRRCE